MPSKALIAAAKRRKEEQGRRGLNRQAPGIEPPKGIERRYRAELRQLVRDLESEIRDRLLDRLSELAAERDRLTRVDSWDEDVDQIINSLTVFGEQRSERVIAGLEAKATAISEWNRRSFARSMRSVLGVDVFARGAVDGEWLRVELGSWARENAKLIKSIPEQMLTQVEGITQRGLRSGRNPREMATEIRDRFGVTESRARLIARDQTSKLNSNLTQGRQRRLGIDKYVWVSSSDERVRDTHDAMNGLMGRWDDPSVYSDDDGETWKSRSSIGAVDLHPGEDFQCFPGSTKLNGAPLYDVLYRRHYDGTLVNITLEDGRIVSATPNHPILTINGFKPIHLIGDGDYVLGTAHERANGVKLYPESFIPTFEQVFCSLRHIFPAVSKSPGECGQFHGDGTDAEVEVVRVDSLLVDEGYAIARKKFLEFGLTSSDMPVCHSLFSGFGNGDLMGLCEGNTLGALVSRLDLICSIFFAHLSPFEQFSFALRSGCDSGFHEPSSDGIPGDVEVYGDSVFAVSVLVHGRDLIDRKIQSVGRGSLVFDNLYASLPHRLAEIVRVDAELLPDADKGSTFNVEPLRVTDHSVSDFSGHVYNLQSKTGYYHAASVAASNCRCFSRPVLDDVLEEL